MKGTATSWIAICVVLVLTALPSPAKQISAHPHAWIDVRVDMLFDEDGYATGMRQHWLFDEFYTVFALEGLGAANSQDPTKEELDEIVRLNVRNLESYDYFTEVEHLNDRVDFQTATDLASDYELGRLEMTFVVPFKLPLDVAAVPLTYGVFDPTYYIEMLHADIETPITLEGAPNGCDIDILAPNPTFEAVSLAASVDRDLNQINDGLGGLFAERVTVSC